VSADKHRSRARRLRLLRMAAARWSGPSDRLEGILLHAEGGMAMDNPDLKRLVSEGHLRIVRRNWMGYPLPPKKFLARFMREVHGQSLHGKVNRTFAILTERGRAALLTQRI